MTGSVDAGVIDDQVLGKMLTGMEISQIVQLTKDFPNGSGLRKLISNQFYKNFKTKFKLLNECDQTDQKFNLMIVSADGIDYFDCEKRLSKKIAYYWLN
jgi:hypothetical protein